MIETKLILAVLIGIALLLLLILKFRIHAFIALLIGSLAVGLIAGLDAHQIMETVQNGMGGTLGFVATVVGLGAIFGGILEASGGAKAIADFMISKFGLQKAPVSMVISGFVIAIPVFFDVAFIILVPMIYALQRKTRKSLLLYAIPLLSGLAIAHAFIPPTPGPIAVADIIGVDLGWVILIGILTGIPTALISGLWFGKYISKKIFVAAPEEIQQGEKLNLPPALGTLAIIGLPLLLILVDTATSAGAFGIDNPFVLQAIALVGHPFSALILANLIAWYFLGLKRNFTKEQLLKISTDSLAPAGTIILLTGAGGVFKQVLTDTGAGELLAGSLGDAGIPVLGFAFITAAIVRVIQGSSTVAMITAAGLVSPVLVDSGLSPLELACMVIAIASGASIFSHVNDSGFWLVGQYLGISEKQTFRSWTTMTTILAFVGMLSVSLIYWLV